MGKIVGIDLGTTNSCAAVMQGGDPMVIPNAEGNRTTPSVVALNKSGDRLVGQIAKRQAVTNPDNTIFSVKRFIGRSWTDSKTKKDRELMPYAMEKDGKGHVQIVMGDKKYAPQEISAMVLQKIKVDAEKFLGEEVTEAVITVPAYFDDSQRKATKDAGKIAGLEVKRIINEPTAAALAYGLDKKDKNIKVAVYDFGGGTFDISILELGDGVFEVKATNGDTHLGGDDVDQAIIDWMVAEFKKAEGIDLGSDKMALQRLKEAAEKTKIELSTVTESEINLPFVTADASGPKHLNLKLTRAKLEELTDDLVARSIEPCRKALKDAELKASDIDEVILVGGQTRMPLIAKKVEEFFGKKPHQGVNPDEVVAIGAAIQGGVLMGDVKDVLLLDVTPLTLGIETLGGVRTPIIPRNTTIPTSKSQVFSTAADNQPSVEVHVLQGEREMASDNKSLGKFILDGIPPAPRGVPQVEVAFDIDANGMLNVSAKDKGTGKEQKITIQASTNLTDEEVEKMQQEAEKYAEEDKGKKEKAELKNHADTLVYSTRKTLADLGDKVPEDQKNEIEEKVKALEDVKDKDDLEAVKKATEELTQSMHSISELIYKNAEEQTSKLDDEGEIAEGETKSDGDSDASKKDGDVEEGEVSK